MKAFLPLLALLFFPSAARSEEPLMIFECYLGEHLPVRSVQVYKWARRLSILELKEEGWEFTAYLPEADYIAKKIPLHPGPGMSGLVYEDADGWKFRISHERGYTSGTTNCFSR